MPKPTDGDRWKPGLVTGNGDEPRGVANPDGEEPEYRRKGLAREQAPSQGEKTGSNPGAARGRTGEAVRGDREQKRLVAPQARHGKALQIPHENACTWRDALERRGHL